MLKFFLLSAKDPGVPQHASAFLLLTVEEKKKDKEKKKSVLLNPE